MTGETKTLAIWGGGAAAVAVLGLAWVLVRGSALAEDRARLQQLTDEQARAQPPGTRLDTLTSLVQAAAAEQAAALAEATKVLVPELKTQYRAADLVSAATQVAGDHKALRQRAERTAVQLPGTLPLDAGLDPNEAVRRVQLAQLFLYRTVLDELMDSGVAKVFTVALRQNWSDPTGAYAILTADLDFECPFDRAQTVLQRLLANHSQGIGIRGISLVPGTRADAPLRIKLTVSLLTANDPDWKLTPEKAATPLPAAKPTRSGAPPVPAKPGGGKPALGDD